MVVAKENRVLKVHVVLSATAGCDRRFAYRFEAKPLHLVADRRSVHREEDDSALRVIKRSFSSPTFMLYMLATIRTFCSDLVYAAWNAFLHIFDVFFVNEMLTHNPKLWANLHRRFELSSIDCYRVHAIHA